MRINPIREYFICRKIMILKKEYPVLVQFYETHSGGLNTYHAPMLSSAMGDVMYFCQQRIYRIHAGCAFHYRNTGTELL